MGFTEHRPQRHRAEDSGVTAGTVQPVALWTPACHASGSCFHLPEGRRNRGAPAASALCRPWPPAHVLTLGRWAGARSTSGLMFHTTQVLVTYGLYMLSRAMGQSRSWRRVERATHSHTVITQFPRAASRSCPKPEAPGPWTEGRGRGRGLQSQRASRTGCPPLALRDPALQAWVGNLTFVSLVSQTPSRFSRCSEHHEPGAWRPQTPSPDTPPLTGLTPGSSRGRALPGSRGEGSSAPLS